MDTRIALFGIIVLVVGVALGVVVPLAGVAHDLPSLHPFVVGVVCIVAGAIVTAIGLGMKKKTVSPEEKKKTSKLGGTGSRGALFFLP